MIVALCKRRNRRGWYAARVLCAACGHKWVAVYPCAANPFHLECRVCGAQDSRTRLIPAEDEA